MAQRGTIQNMLKKYFWRRRWERVATVCFVTAFLTAGAGSAYAAAYRDSVYPGVRVGAFPLGGLSREEAERALSASLETLRNRGLVFVFRDRTISVPMVATAPGDPDLSYEVIDYDIAGTIDRAYAVGRDGSFFGRWAGRVGALGGGVRFEPKMVWRQEKALETLKQNLAAFESPAQDAHFVFGPEGVAIAPERDGIVFNYGRALAEAKFQLELLIFSPILLELERDTAEVTAAEALPFASEVRAFARRGPATVRFEELSWELSRSVLNGLLEIRRASGGEFEIGISRVALEKALEPAIAAVTAEPQEPRFALENRRVAEFKTSAPGRRVTIDETQSAWEAALLRDDAVELALVVDVVAPQQEVADLNNLGIRELLGVGKSNFAGSPPNRRHNIRIGAEAVNGTLIPPGEEFSLLKTLGTIDGTTGYLPELVIKGNKTVPEFGGGLCQIGTTTFRGTLAAGLPVTERRNHSYSVSYYLDAKGLPGTDATIYNPAPDYRFKNDTENHVLIITRIEESEVFFEYWGTKDGRVATQSDTRVWDRIPPPPTQYIETLDLPVGKTKCTESPHAGIKAAFDYAIAYPDGTVNETTFTSQYRPWQAVCLVGVEKLSEEPMAEEEVRVDTAENPAAIVQ